MNICPITYQEIPPGQRYSAEGLSRLAPGLRDLHNLPYSAEEQRSEAVARASKMSIKGIQPKLSARLNTKEQVFEIADRDGQYILKPEIEFPEVPLNEDLTMRMAALVGIEVPLHGLIYSKDGSLTYFIKRFDRAGKNQKVAVEDFAQLLGRTRDTKYRSSMEQVASVINQFCTFPLVEKVKLFRLTLFSFLVGNEDMHLKNFSLITRDQKIELSPAYDLLNTTIVLPATTEEFALPLDGRKKNFTRSLLVTYFGNERLGLREPVVQEILSEFSAAFPHWEGLVGVSFLSDAMREKYMTLLSRRRKLLDI
ncbi:MAG: HipA domain-containing protein [Fidelibacterota bacterium]